MADAISSLSVQEIEDTLSSNILHDRVAHSASHAGEPLHGTNYINAAQYDNQELHIVMVPYPLLGHINPMIQLAKVLISKHGMRVTFVNNKNNHDRIRDTQAASLKPASSQFPNIMQQVAHPQHQDSCKLHFLWVDDGLPPSFDYTDLTLSRIREIRFATRSMKDPFKQLVQSLNQKSPPVSCVMFGSFCPWAHTVAEELGIRSIFFWTQSTCAMSIYYHAPLLAANGFFPYKKKALQGCDEDQDMPEKAPNKVSYIPGVPPLHPSRCPTLLHIDSMSDPNVASIINQFAILPKCGGVIVNSFEELEKDAYEALQAVLPFPVLLVGPLIPTAFLEGGDVNDTSVGASLLQEKSDCIQWLDSQKNQSVLYVSFGSVLSPSAEDLESIANGIRASNKPFLWVVRARSSASNVADILPEGFIEDTREHGLIIPWAPQMQVLSHPSIGTFLTHCGWNSTLESVSMGMPMIPFPLHSDQPTNCTFVCDVWKIGMAIRMQVDGKVKSVDVERVIRIVLDEQEGREMRKRAGELRKLVRRAVLPQGSSHIHMEKLIEAMRNQSPVKIAGTI